jgi:hypothetical protein
MVLLYNLPIGAITVAFILVFFQAPKNTRARATGWREQLNQFDLLGTALFLPAVVCVLLTLQWGGSTYPWSDGRIIALFMIFGVLMSGFVAVQIWKQENATVPPRIVKNRSVWGSAVFTACLGGSFFSLLYFVCSHFLIIFPTLLVAY